MSQELTATLNTQTLIGFTAKRGNAWHYRASDQGAESNHYDGEIPAEDVRRRLFEWQAVPRKVAVSSPFGEGEDDFIWAPVPERQAWVRSDTGALLGIFTPGYDAHQYDRWLLEVTETLKLPIGSAGVLRGGKIAWVQAELADNVETKHGVAFRPNFLAGTSFDGSVATFYKRTNTIVVCDNTFAVAQSEDGPVSRVRHTKGSQLRLTEMASALDILEQTGLDFAAQTDKMIETEVTARQWSRFLDRWVPNVDAKQQPLTGRKLNNAITRRDALNKLWISDPRVSPWAGTAWGVAQAVNTFNHHVQNVRGDERAERNMLHTIRGQFAADDADAARTLALVLAS